MPLLHISNIQIPKILSAMLKIDLAVFEKGGATKALSTGYSMVDKTNIFATVEQIDAIVGDVPEEIKIERKMKALAHNIGYTHMVFSPLYYVKMRHYNALFFRFIDENFTLGLGGSYDCEGIASSGFGLYSDEVIEILIKKDR